MVTCQISCLIPMTVWNSIKEIADRDGVTATKLTTRALEQVVADHSLDKSLREIKAGSRVSTTYTNGQLFSRHQVYFKRDVPGIFIKQAGLMFIPLRDFETVKLEK